MKKLLGPSSRRPDITFRPDGRIDIAARVARALALSPGDIIDVAEPIPGEYCLYVRLCAPSAVGRHEGRCYPVITRLPRGAYRAWSKRLAAAVIRLAGGSDRPLRLSCGTPFFNGGQTYIPIILKLAL